MDDLMKNLYTFTKERRLGSLYDDPEYEEMTRSVEMQTKKVQKGMTEDQRFELNLLLANVFSLHSIEDEHLFQTVLELAQELRTLV